MSRLSRRQFIHHTSAAAAMGMVVPLRVLCEDGPDYITTEIADGKLRGVREDGVNIFRGIPYGGRVSGDRRFRAPAPLEPWPGLRDALTLGPPAIQAPNGTYGLNEPEPAEDCLVLNVWTPANDNNKRPVMFYNHGGGFAAGSGGSVAADGANLARLYNVVVVETNHRLGLLGYLYLDEVAGEDYSGSGVRGMLDIVLGLKWVHDNIDEFGGDPDNVMIWGESGGGAKTSCLYAMPPAKDYFNKASIESGPGVRMREPEVAAETTALLLEQLDIPPKDWRRLLEVPAPKLLEMQLKLPRLAPGNPSTFPMGGRHGIMRSRIGDFGPVVGGRYLPRHPFDPAAPEISRDKPLITGWNEDEYVFFALFSGDTSALQLDDAGLAERLQTQFGDDAQRVMDTYKETRPQASPSDIFVAISSIRMMGLGSIWIAEKKVAQHGAPVYLYNFGYKSETKVPGTDYPMGTPHAADIPFKFCNLPQASDDGANPSGSMAGARPERFTAERNFSEMWTTFARTGKPVATGQPEWPPYDLETRPTMRISDTCEVINDRYREERLLWESLS